MDADALSAGSVSLTCNFGLSAVDIEASDTVGLIVKDGDGGRLYQLAGNTKHYNLSTGAGVDSAISYIEICFMCQDPPTSDPVS